MQEYFQQQSLLEVDPHLRHKGVTDELLCKAVRQNALPYIGYTTACEPFVFLMQSTFHKHVERL